MTIKGDLEAIYKEAEMGETNEVDKINIFINETDLRKIISDYIYKRSGFKNCMTWESEFSSTRLIINLEGKPYTQESLGYRLLKEKVQI